MNSIRDTNGSFDLCTACKQLVSSRLPSYTSQNFRLCHVSNLFVLNFRIFLLMYPGVCLRVRLTGSARRGPSQHRLRLTAGSRVRPRGGGSGARLRPAQKEPLLGHRGALIGHAALRQLGRDQPTDADTTHVRRVSPSAGRW